MHKCIWKSYFMGTNFRKDYVHCLTFYLIFCSAFNLDCCCFWKPTLNIGLFATWLYVFVLFLKKESVLQHILFNVFIFPLTSSKLRQWHPTPVLLPGKSHGWRSLVGCSPWGHKESDTTEQLHFDFSLSCIGEGNGNPLQCSCLENPRDGGSWWPAVYGIAQSRTRLKRLSSSRWTWFWFLILSHSRNGNVTFQFNFKSFLLLTIYIVMWLYTIVYYIL